MGKKYEIKEMK